MGGPHAAEPGGQLSAWGGVFGAGPDRWEKGRGGSGAPPSSRKLGTGIDLSPFVGHADIRGGGCEEGGRGNANRRCCPPLNEAVKLQ